MRVAGTMLGGIGEDVEVRGMADVEVWSVDDARVDIAEGEDLGMCSRIARGEKYLGVIVTDEG